MTSLPHWRFELGRCREVITRHFNVGSLDGFGLGGKPLAVCASGVIIQYLNDTQPASLNLLTGLNTYSTSEFMNLDAATQRNLELIETIRAGSGRGSLLGQLDCAITPMGKRLLRQWVSKPLLDVERIFLRQQGVNHFFTNGLLRAELRNALKLIGDLERLTTRVVSRTAQPRDLVGIRSTLQRLPYLEKLLMDDGDLLSLVLKDLSMCTDELTLLESAISDDPPATLQNIGIIRKGFSAELDGVIDRSKHARDWISNLENSERARTGIKTIKVGYNKVFGYYIEISRANAVHAPDEYIRKQTLVNAERFITPELKEYESLVLNAEERIHEIEGRIFEEICERLEGSAHRLLSTARTLAALDVLATLAETAAINGYVRPAEVSEDVLDIMIAIRW
jgi:DNA mismatch repair protein MutS